MASDEIDQTLDAFAEQGRKAWAGSPPDVADRLRAGLSPDIPAPVREAMERMTAEEVQATLCDWIADVLKYAPDQPRNAAALLLAAEAVEREQERERDEFELRPGR